MYNLPKPKTTTKTNEPWLYQDFQLQLKSIAEENGGIVFAPDTVHFTQYTYFWIQVGILLPPEWKLKESGIRDAGRSRLLAPSHSINSNRFIG